MSEDENPATGGQHQNDADFDANNSIIDKVKSRVSSIFPQTLSKWFSPTISSIDDNRNGNLRRRRDEQLDNNEKRHQQNSDDSESDGGGSGSRSDVDLILMPPSKKSRLNYNEDYPIMPPNRNLFASTPMVGCNRRKNVEIIKNTEIPYNFATTSTFINDVPSADVRGIDESRYIDDVTVKRDWCNKKNISSRRSLNIPTTSSYVNSQSPVIRNKNSKIYENLEINESGEQSININNENDEDEDDIPDVENDDDEDDEEIRKAQKQYLTNGLRQSIRRGNVNAGGNLNDSTGRISRSGGAGIGDSASESDESQCSSQRNNMDKPKTGLFYPNLGGPTMTINSQTGSKRTSSMANSLNFYSHLEGKKSLFSEKNMNSILHNSTLSLTSLNRRQQFNASLYGSTSALSDSRLLNTISPFYKGRTTYGGASAYNKYAQLSQQQQQRQLRVTPTLMRPTSSLSSSSNNSLIQETNNQQNINSNTSNTVISSTAKRILDLMDQFTTPLDEVKKMASGIKVPLSLSPANKKRFTEDDLIASRGIRLSKPLTPYSRPISLSQQQTQSGQLPPPISELHVPSMAQLLQLKRLQNNNEKLREIANSSKSILNQREDYKLPNETNLNNNNNSNNNNNISDNINGGKHVNKMKNKITTTRQSNKNQQNEQQFSDINLPNVQLPFMKSVPKIDIKITPPLSTKSDMNISPQSSNLSNRTSGIFNTENLNNKKEINSENTTFNISPRKPINHKELINTTTKLNGDIAEFIFSSPIKINDNQLDNKNINIESINNFKFSPPVAVDSLMDEIGDSTSNNRNIIQDQNKSATISFVANKNNSEILCSNLLKTTSTTIMPQLKTGSVLDALKKSTPITSNTTVISPIKQSLISSDFGDKFKMSSNKWECSVCMIRNDETTNKCIACETPKTSTTKASTTDKSIIAPISTPLNQSFGNKFKPSSDTWECDACMVRNKNDVTQCIACNTKKSGSIQSLSSLPTTTATKLTTSLDSGFKNIVAQQTASKWECTVCMTRNDSNRTKCICCEQSKPGANTDSNTKFSFGSAAASASTTSQFKFGFGVDSSAPQTDDSKNKLTTVGPKISTNKKTDDKTDAGFVFSGQNSAKDFIPSTEALTGFTFGFKTTNESTPAIPSNTVSVSSGSAAGFKFGVAQTTTSTINENKPISQTKSTALLVTDKISDTNKPAPVTTASSTINLFNNTGFNFGVESTSGLKFTGNSPSSPSTSSQKISIDNKSESSTSITGSAFKSVGGFSFGAANTKTPVTINETKPQLFGAVTTSTATEPVKGFVFGNTTTTATPSTSTTSTTISLATTTVKKDEALKLFSGFIAPTNKITEPVKTTAPTMQQSTFSSSNFTFGEPLKNAATNIVNPITTAPATEFGSGNSSSNFVFGVYCNTPLFGGAIAPPTVNVQATSPTTFGNIKPSLTVPATLNQQPKSSSLFGSSNISSSNLGSTFGNNNNQSSIVPPTPAPTTSIFGSSFSASNVKSSISSETAPATAATSTTVANQQSPANLFSFGGGGAVKNEITTTTASIPTLFGNTSTSTTALVPNSGFVFGASKPIESTSLQSNSIFGTGMTSNTSNNTAFGSTSFGSVSNNNTNSAFGQGQPNVNPFGSSSSNTPQLHNTGFGTSVAPPAFGSSSNATFGSNAPSQQPFGSNNPSLSFGGFGNSNRITGDSSDCSSAKKPAESGFNFGSAPPQNTNPGFSFGSNNNNNNNSNITKPAFNFSAPVQTPTPSFNFTGANEANSSQPFQFGAPSNTANIQMPLFNNYVGNESTPNTPFQFNAANNIFAPTPTPGTPSAQQGRRKIRTAARRINPRNRRRHNKTDDAFKCSKTCSSTSTNSRTEEITKTTNTIRTNLYKIKSVNDINDNDKQQNEYLTETIYDYKNISLENGQKNEDYNDKLINDNVNTIDKDTNRNVHQLDKNQQNLLAKSSLILAKKEGENILNNNKIINNNNNNVILRSSFLFTNLYNKKIQQLNNYNSLNKYKNININNNNNDNEICNTTKPSVEITSNLFNNNSINNEINKNIIYNYNTTQRKMFSNFKKKYHNKLLLSSMNTSKLSVLHNNYKLNRYKFIRKSLILNQNDIDINKNDDISNTNNNNNIKLVTSPSLSVSQQEQQQNNDEDIKLNNVNIMKKFKNNINLYGHNKRIFTNRTDDQVVDKSKYHYIKPKE